MGNQNEIKHKNKFFLHIVHLGILFLAQIAFPAQVIAQSIFVEDIDTYTQVGADESNDHEHLDFPTITKPDRLGAIIDSHDSNEFYETYDAPIIDSREPVTTEPTDNESSIENLAPEPSEEEQHVVQGGNASEVSETAENIKEETQSTEGQEGYQEDISNQQRSTVNVGTFAALENAINNATLNTPLTINLTANINMPRAIHIDRVVNVTIQSSNTSTLTYVGGAEVAQNRRHFYLAAGSLTIGNNVVLAGTDSPEGRSGGINIISNGTLILDGGRLTGNSDTEAGGAVRVRGGTFHMRSGEIDNNRVTSSWGTGGGAVMVEDNGTFVMDGGIIQENSIPTVGGAVSLVSGRFNMTNGSIQNNTGATGGGGVSVSGGVFNMTNGSIQNNTGITGGGILTNGGTFNMTGGTISGNSADVGGGVFITLWTSWDSTSLTEIVNNAAISNNQALRGNNLATSTSSEEGLRDLMERMPLGVDTTAIIWGDFMLSSGRLFLTAGRELSLVSGNEEIRTIFSNRNDRHFSVRGKLTLENVILDGSGEIGGIVQNDDGHFVIESGGIQNTIHPTWAGAIELNERAHFTMNGGTIRNTVADNAVGGALRANGSSMIVMNDGVIENNHSINGNGGAITLAGSDTEFIMNGGTIRDNTAAYGGAVSSMGSVKIYDGNVVGNQATRAYGTGGGFHISAGILHIEGGIFQENSAPNGIGGAIFLNSLNQPHFISENVEFNNNKAIASQQPPFGIERAFPNIRSRSVSMYSHPVNDYDIGVASEFAQNNFKNLYIQNNPVDSGVVKVDGEIVEEMRFVSGLSDLTVEIQAHPFDGWQFERWHTSIEGSIENEANVMTTLLLANEDITLIAYFEAPGLRFKNVPETLAFSEDALTMHNKKVTIPRADPDWAIQIRDTRGSGSNWTLSAAVQQPLTAVDGNHQLPEDAFVFINEAGEKLILGAEKQALYQGITGTDSFETRIAWSPTKGPLLRLRPIAIQPDTIYQTEIIWTLSDTPL